MYFANIGNSTGRTIETKVFTKLKDAKSELANMPGYIISAKETQRNLVKFCNGFMPSAQEIRNIEAITGMTWDQITQKAHKDSIQTLFILKGNNHEAYNDKE